MSKFIYIGSIGLAPSFYTKLENNRIRGYSKTIESGDILVLDSKLEDPCFRVKEVSKRNYNGVFKNPEDAINSFFDAQVDKISIAEVLELRKSIPKLQELFV